MRSDRLVAQIPAALILVCTLRQPGRVDQQTVEWLGACLVEHRKVKDTIGSRPLLGIVRRQLGVVVELAPHARGSPADTVPLLSNIPFALGPDRHGRRAGCARRHR
ncbi:hypothetical protein SAMN05216276_10896 [Streptosporangium subroseum]|uniref:Uncharacterized protein n=1 Tax=Streptosporangium subroseum TaxID=106412 RepID=A0A239P572_9ACTN|nr:hypothetical protein SAMN05216276_10896 [Streptosporangium subroseum]